MCASVFRKSTLLSDCRTLEYILLGDLRDVLEEEPDEMTHKWMMAIIDALLTTLPRELDLAESGFFLNIDQKDFREHSAEFDLLLNEKHKIYVCLRQLRAELLANSLVTETTANLKQELHHWMKALVHHHRQERHLAQTLKREAS